MSSSADARPSHAATPRAEVEEIGDLADFRALEAAWNELLSRSHFDVPFLRHEWLSCWWEHFGESRRLAVVVVRRGERLIFAAPLLEERGPMGFVRLRSMTNHHSFRHGFLVSRDDEEGARAFWRYLEHRPRPWDLLQMQEIPGDDTGHALVLEAAPATLRSHRTIVTRSPYVPIRGAWDEYFAGLKRKFRSNMRNRTKRLSGEGDVSRETVTGGERLHPALAAGFEIERRSWKGESGTAIATDPRLTSFYTRWAEIAAARGWLRLSLLEVGGTAVAVDYSLVYGKRLFCMKIGYDPAYSKYSVGQLLTGEVLRGCFDDGLDEFDFLGDTTIQKRDWSSWERDIVWLFVYNRTVKGRIHERYKFGIKRGVKRMIERRRAAESASDTAGDG